MFSRSSRRKETARAPPCRQGIGPPQRGLCPAPANVRARRQTSDDYTAVCLGGAAASGWDLPALTLLDDSSSRQAPHHASSDGVTLRLKLIMPRLHRGRPAAQGPTSWNGARHE